MKNSIKKSLLILPLLPLIFFSCEKGYEGEIPDSIIVTPEEVYIVKGSYQTFTAQGIFSDGTSEDLTQWVEWSSSNPNVGEISEEAGKVLGKEVGEVYIVASLGGVCSNPAEMIVTSGNPDELVAIRVEGEDEEIVIGDATKFSATGIYGDLSIKDITEEVEWLSLVPDVIQVISTGDAVGMSHGVGEVRASSGDINSNILSLSVIDDGSPRIIFDPNPPGAQGAYTIVLAELVNFHVPTTGEDVSISFDPYEVLFYGGYILSESELELYLLLGVTADPVIEMKVFYGSGVDRESASGSFLIERYTPIEVESGETITGSIEEAMGYELFALELNEGDNVWAEFSSDYFYPYIMAFDTDGLTILSSAIYALGFEAEETGRYYIWMMDYWGGGGSGYDYSAYFEFPTPGPSITVTKDPAGEEGSFMIIPVTSEYMNLGYIEDVIFDTSKIVYYSAFIYDIDYGDIWAVAGPDLPEEVVMTVYAGGQSADSTIHIQDRTPTPLTWGPNAGEGVIETDYETDYYSITSPEGWVVRVDASSTTFTPYLFALKEVGALIAGANTYGVTFPTTVAGNYYILVLDTYLTGSSSYSYTLSTEREFYLGTPFLSEDSFPITIPDDSVGYPEPGTPVTSEIIISGLPDIVAHLYVWVYITHSFPSDIRLTLTGPQGTEMVLSDYTGNGIGYPTIFGYNADPDDEMTFNDILSHGINGTWSLTAVDNFPADEGKIQEWAIFVEE